MARAMRREEIPLLEKKYEEDSVKDRIFWEQQEEEKVLRHALFSLFGTLEIFMFRFRSIRAFLKTSFKGIALNTIVLISVLNSFVRSKL